MRRTITRQTYPPEPAVPKAVQSTKANKSLTYSEVPEIVQILTEIYFSVEPRVKEGQDTKNPIFPLSLFLLFL